MIYQVASEFQVYEQASVAVADNGYDLSHAGMWLYEKLCFLIDAYWMPHILDDRFASALGMVGIALLTIMIPIAVAIFDDSSEDYGFLDRNTLLDRIVKAKNLLYYIALIYTPIFLWGLYPHWVFNTALLGVWAFGIYGISGILKNSYRWIKEDKFEERAKYLQELSDTNNLQYMVPAWLSYWKVKAVHFEWEFSDIFASTFNKLMEGDSKESHPVALELIKGFNKFMDMRSELLVINYVIHRPQFIKWHFISWQQSNLLTQEEHRQSTYKEIQQAISNTLVMTQKKAIRENRYFPVFDLERIIEQCKKQYEVQLEYIELLISLFFRTLVENITDDEKLQMHGVVAFPEEWLITAEGLKKQKNNPSEIYVPKVLWDEFHRWAKNKITAGTECDDFVLAVVSKDLFPRVSSMMWGNILISAMRRDNSAKSLIENPINFDEDGVLGLTIEEECYSEAERQDAEKEAAELALLLFGNIFTECNLKKYISELNDLEKHNHSGDKDSVVEFRIQNYRDTFRRILEVLQQRKKED